LEIVKRWEKVQFNEAYETPGLGSRTYEGAPSENGTAPKLTSRPNLSEVERQQAEAAARLAAEKAAAREAKSVERIKISDEDKAAIKKSSFPLDMLAQIYHVTTDQILLIQNAKD
jgi:hypothetical protein